MGGLKAINLMTAFAIEICMLVGLGYFGFTLDTHTILRVVAGLGLPMVVAILWGIFAAPKSKTRLRQPSLTILKVVLFIGTALLLWLADTKTIAVVFLTIALVNLALLQLLRQDNASHGLE